MSDWAAAVLIALKCGVDPEDIVKAGKRGIVGGRK